MSLKKLVEEITKPILQEGINDPGILKAVFLAGGPGSGKTRTARWIFGIPDRFKLGTGHVKFFYDKLFYLFKRYVF